IRHFLFKTEQEVPYFYLKKVRFYENVSFSVPSSLVEVFLYVQTIILRKRKKYTLTLDFDIYTKAQNLDSLYLL
ncbi:hypothetical protein, partial [Lysinibacillus xylanilyticus]|uniref:hypothetical protein n=1 Tax=Lysinibacillus xylanilyticus TaxID=582475 RepID=UPI003CFF4AEF